MNELVEFDFREMVSVSGDEVVTTSLKVAEYFGKPHRSVLRKIRNIMSECSTAFSEHNFVLADYIDEQGKPRPMYEVTKDGWIMLVMGFTGVQAAAIKEKYIIAFNAMYAALQNIKQSGFLALNQLEIKKAKSSVKGRFGSFLMNERKKEKRLLEKEEVQLIATYQHQLPLAV
jgi:Rha family phage regulatory protein